MIEKQNEIKLNKFSLIFDNDIVEHNYRMKYNESIMLPLRSGIIISILSWYSGISLIYVIIPDHFQWLGTFTFLYIGSFFGFIVYATFRAKLLKYYHTLGALSNAWAGLFSIYFCDFFPNGEILILPILIFIVFFGLYMIRLRWIAAFIAVLSYTIAYHIYLTWFSDIATGQILFNLFVSWMTLIFVVFAGRLSEANSRILFLQRRTIHKQGLIIEQEKELLLKEVHHRVQNNLQLIVSLVNIQLYKLDKSNDSSVLKDMKSRIISMSLVHQQMKQTSNFSQINLKDFAKDLLDSLASLYSNHNLNAEINISKDILIDVDRAISLGLIINEIGANYYKHCNTANCKFNISGVVYKDSVLIKYHDDGDGFPGRTSKETDNTLGFELIEDLAQQIDGDFKFYNDNGAVYEISYPLE